MNSINNPCGHTGFKSNVCEICGYPDPSKMIASLKQQIASLKCCGNCTSYYIKWCDGEEMKDFKTVIEYKTSISGLEKIEPLNPRNVSSEYWNATHENRDKLNEVIDKVNRIMEVMNKKGE